MQCLWPTPKGVKSCRFEIIAEDNMANKMVGLGGLDGLDQGLHAEVQDHVILNHFIFDKLVVCTT